MQTVGLSKAFGATPIFDQVGFTIAPGDRLAVVGRNGAGKTTLLRCLAGQIEADEGTVSMPRGAVVSLHDQRPPRDRGVTLGAYIREGLSDLLELEDALRMLEGRMADGDHGPEVLGEYDRLQREFERMGGYSQHAWLDRVERGLTIDPDWRSRPLASFSGGELTRASLARALVAQPDVLLLDEPTNHLDLESVEWLEGALSEIDAAIVIVSHDRWFLESVTTKVLDLDGPKARLWNMGYSAFRRAKAEALARQAQLAEAQAREIARLERFVERWRAGTRSRQATSRRKRLESIDRIAPPTREASLEFGFPSAERPGRLIVECDGLTIGHDEPLVRDANFAIERGWRVAVVGPNGAGKTTLVETLLGRRAPMSGRCSIGHRVQMNYFTQHADELDGTRTLVETVLAGSELTNTQGRGLLGRFLFGADRADRRVEVLSGGERRRLSLVQMIARGGNVLVLDEPTNHLDIESREALEDALAAFDGTVIFVTHDRALIDLMATHVLALDGGTAAIYEGGYTDLLERREREAGDEASAPARPSRSQSRQTTANDGKAPPRRRNRGRAERLENEIASLEAEVADIERRLADPEVVVDHQAVAELGDRHQQLTARIDVRMLEWEKAEGGA